MELGILSDAKNEFTEQIIMLLTPRIHEGIRSIFELCKKKCIEKKSDENSLLPSFQLLLSDISKWNNETIMNEYERIQKKTNCKYLEDLLTAVFISHTRVLSSIRNSNKKKNINLKIPKIHNFIHKCYINTAREFWKYTYLFNETNNKLEVQKNMKQLEDIIKQSILLTIRKLLPVYDILKEYLMENVEETLDESSDEEKDKHLQYLIRNELNEFKKQEELNQNKNYNDMLLIENNQDNQDNQDNLSNNENDKNYNLLIEQLIESNKDDINNEELLEEKYYSNQIKENINNEFLKDESLKDESLKDETIEDESLKDDFVKGEILKDESLKDEFIKDENLKNESVKDESESVKDESESVKDENLKDESVKDEIIKDISVKDESESVKDESVKDKILKDISEKDESEKDESESVKEENIKNIVIDAHIDTTGSKKKKPIQSQKKKNYN